MSRIRANTITNQNANGAPNFPDGLTVSGVVTATTTNSTSNQIVVGSAVTANSQGVDVTGIVTATSFVGSGANLTGIDATAIQTGTTKVQTFATLISNQVSGSGIATVQAGGLDVTGIVTATSFAGSGANLTSLPAANLTGALPAISGANLTGITAKVVQCVTSYYSSQHSTTSSTLQNTGHTLAITPTSNSNKIIVMNQTNGGNTGPGRSWKHMLTYTIGGSTTNARYMQNGDDGDNSSFAFSHVLYWFHSSPGTAEITYQTMHATDGSGTAYYGYSGSYMVAWEVTP